MPGAVPRRSQAGADQSEADYSRFCFPSRVVLGPVIDQKQKPRGRKTLNQAVQQSLSLRINPVQILDDQKQTAEPGSPEARAVSLRPMCVGGAGKDRSFAIVGPVPRHPRVLRTQAK